MRDYYQILGVNRDADPAEIRASYISLAKKYHPDVSQENPEIFVEIREAYDQLSDPESREKFDRRWNHFEATGMDLGEPVKHYYSTWRPSQAYFRKKSKKTGRNERLFRRNYKGFGR